MSIVKDFVLIALFLIIVLNYIALHKNFIKQKKFFIDTLSHDLRVSAIAQIRGIELLLKEQKDNEILNELSKSCYFSLDMINMLLNIYKFDNKEKFLNYENFNLKNSILSCYSKFSNEISSKNIQFVLDTKNFKFINVDKIYFDKALSILIETAICNSKKDSFIQIKTQKTNSRLKIYIKYIGKNLTDEEYKRMFEKNSQFSTVGHGIKMLLCKKIIDFHNGKILIKNNKNENYFIISLPNHKNKTSFEKTLLLSTKAFNT